MSMHAHTHTFPDPHPPLFLPLHPPHPIQEAVHDVGEHAIGGEGEVPS